MSSEPPSAFRWYTPFAIALLVLPLVIAGISTFLLAMGLQWLAARIPIWDWDRRWDGIKGAAVLGGLLYAAWLAHLLVFAGAGLDLVAPHIGLRLLDLLLDYSPAALLSHWSAGLLLGPAFALAVERSTPHTHRFPTRMVTQAEQQLLDAREQERQRTLDAEQQRRTAAAESERKRLAALAEAKASRSAPASGPSTTEGRPDTPLDPATLDPRTFWERVPDDAPAKQLAREEAARNEFVAEQAKALGVRPSQPIPQQTSAPSPSPKASEQEKQDKGDGSMDTLL